MSIKKQIFPAKLVEGDEIRVIAPSFSMSIISKETHEYAKSAFSKIGLNLSFGKNVEECDQFVSSSIVSRVEDLHKAFSDPKVKGILTTIGGFNSNQILDSIDWNLIQKNPKVFCGYSDITALQNAIYAKTGLITYSGPHYSTFGDLKSIEYTVEYFKKCLFSDKAFNIQPSKQWSDDIWYVDQEKRTFITNTGYLPINPGTAEGTLIGGNLCTLNLLQGTKYFPSLDGSILFLEDDADSHPVNFDRDLLSLIQQPDFDKVKGLVIGRFQKNSKFADDLLIKILESKKQLKHLPILANADFGHTTPMITFPIGGRISFTSGKESLITLLAH